MEQTKEGCRTDRVHLGRSQHLLGMLSPDKENETLLPRLIVGEMGDDGLRERDPTGGRVRGGLQGQR